MLRQRVGACSRYQNTGAAAAHRFTAAAGFIGPLGNAIDRDHAADHHASGGGNVAAAAGMSAKGQIAQQDGGQGGGRYVLINIRLAVAAGVESAAARRPAAGPGGGDVDVDGARGVARFAHHLNEAVGAGRAAAGRGRRRQRGVTERRGGAARRECETGAGGADIGGAGCVGNGGGDHLRVEDADGPLHAAFRRQQRLDALVLQVGVGGIRCRHADGLAQRQHHRHQQKNHRCHACNAALPATRIVIAAVQRLRGHQLFLTATRLRCVLLNPVVASFKVNCICT